MAHIEYLVIDGLLGRKNRIECVLNRDVNIFFGENGCGKTTLLKIIDAALNKDGAAMESMPVERAEVHVYSITDKKILRHVWERGVKVKKSPSLQELRAWHAINSEQISLDFAFSGVERSAWKITPRVRDNERRWSHTFLPTTRLYISDKSPARQARTENSLSESRLDDVFAESVNRTWLLYYSQVLRVVSRIQEDGLRAVLHNVLLPGPISPPNPDWDFAATHTRVNNFLARQPDKERLSIGTLDGFKSRYREDENLRRAVDNINEVERQIEEAMVPIEQFKTTVKMLFSNGKSISTTSNNQLQVELENGTLITPANLSSGEKHLLKILLAAMTAGPNTVIVDEPELSMHIDWQQDLVRNVLALNPNCQLIMASHSPEIMADIPDNRIFKI